MDTRQQTTTKPSSAVVPHQATAGRALLQRKCACGGSSGMTGSCPECETKKLLGKSLQAKLAISEPGDTYEQEADRVAEQVMASPAHSAVSATPLRIQRFAGQTNGQVTTAPPSVDRVLASSGSSLEPVLRQDMEQRFGHDFSNVQVHSGSAAEQSARDVNAHAYTVGHHIVFGMGRFAPGTHEGRRLLAHELAHTIQQGSGLMKPEREPAIPYSVDPASEAMANALSPVPVALRSVPQVSRFWPFDNDEENLAFKSIEAEVNYRIGKPESGQHQKAYQALNGQSVTAMLATLDKLKPAGVVGKLIGNFSNATGVNRPRLWIAIMIVQYKGERTADDMKAILKTEIAEMRLANEGDQADQLLAFAKQNEPESDAPAAGTPQPAVATPAEPETFTPEKFPLSNTLVRIVEENDEKKTLKVEESPAVYVRKVLESVKINYDDFYSNFTTIKFFGHQVSPAIHKDFAATLKKIEKDYSQGKQVEKAGQALGIKSVGGSRDYPTSAAFSMHLVGMAVDINYTDSPFIGSSSSDIFGRAGLLIDGTIYSYDEKSRTYEQFEPMQKAIVAYFQLLDDTTKLEEKLKSPDTTRWPLGKKDKLALAKSWEGMTPDLAKKQIQADLTFIAKRWERKEDQVKQHGFLGVSKELIETMTKGNATNWGGGSYGDIMHFDMRTQGKGATINSAFAAYKAAKTKEAKDAYTAEGDEARRSRRETEKAAAKEKAKAKKTQK